MKNTSAKNKLIGLLVLWVVLTAAMFLYFFKILDSSNQLVISNIADQQTTLNQLSAERNAYVKGQQDLQTMSQKEQQPENFFTTDVALIKEIQTLEDWATKLNVKLDLSGLSGTVGGAAKVGTDGNIVSVPYSITITGPFAKVVDYFEVLEHLDFITTINSITMTAGGGDDVTANIGAQFYIRVNESQ